MLYLNEIDTITLLNAEERLRFHLGFSIVGGELVLYDLFGHEQQRYRTDDATININDLPAACYFYQIINKEHQYIQQGKLIKI